MVRQSVIRYIGNGLGISFFVCSIHGEQSHSSQAVIAPGLGEINLVIPCPVQPVCVDNRCIVLLFILVICRSVRIFVRNAGTHEDALTSMVEVGRESRCEFQSFHKIEAEISITEHMEFAGLIFVSIDIQINQWRRSRC